MEHFETNSLKYQFLHPWTVVTWLLAAWLLAAESSICQSSHKQISIVTYWQIIWLVRRRLVYFATANPTRYTVRSCMFVIYAPEHGITFLMVLAIDALRVFVQASSNKRHRMFWCCLMWVIKWENYFFACVKYVQSITLKSSHKSFSNFVFQLFFFVGNHFFSISWKVMLVGHLVCWIFFFFSPYSLTANSSLDSYVATEHAPPGL